MIRTRLLPTRATFLALLSASTLLVASCNGDDEVKTLFDETEGIWSLIRYNLDGMGMNDVIDSRKDAFLLKFVASKKGSGVVAAASCADGSGAEFPNSSTCHLDPASVWNCRCFRYEFEDREMRWLEFAPGSTPPVDVPDAPAGGTGGMGGDEVTVVEVGEVEDIASQYLFQPLPPQLFGSQPEIPSTFLFQQKSTIVWDQPPSTGPTEAASTCDVCFPGM